MEQVTKLQQQERERALKEAAEHKYTNTHVDANGKPDRDCIVCGKPFAGHDRVVTQAVAAEPEPASPLKK